VVVRGETLWRIAKRYGVTVSDLSAANRLSDAARIETGQRLIVPPSGRPVSGFSVEKTAPEPESFVWPVEGRVVSVFGLRGPGGVNKGIDIEAPRGAEVQASRGGRVSFTHENLPGFGKTIILDHGEGFATVYAYLEEILVNSGQGVDQHQVIARVGAGGRARGSALHFEVRRKQKPQNPFHYLP
jgi:murein DD-endopeptidase MepM/ murein hydrolase activator NlpD